MGRSTWTKMKSGLIFSLLLSPLLAKHVLVETEDQVDKKKYKERKGDDFQCEYCHCFDTNSLVETESGRKKMSELVLGDALATYDQNKGKFFTKFLGWLDRGSSVGYFLEVKTKNGRRMRLTGNHLIFIFNDGRQIATYAKDLQPTDILLSLNEEKIEKTEIASLDYVYSNGYRAPLTEEGTLLVDGILASCYASFDHWYSHKMVTPVRMFPDLLDSEESQHQDGTRTVIQRMKQIGTLLGFRMKQNEEKILKESPLGKMMNLIFSSKVEL